MEIAEKFWEQTYISFKVYRQLCVLTKLYFGTTDCQLKLFKVQTNNLKNKATFQLFYSVLHWEIVFTRDTCSLFFYTRKQKQKIVTSWGCSIRRNVLNHSSNPQFAVIFCFGIFKNEKASWSQRYFSEILEFPSFHKQFFLCDWQILEPSLIQTVGSFNEEKFVFQIYMKS